MGKQKGKTLGKINKRMLKVPNRFMEVENENIWKFGKNDRFLSYYINNIKSMI
jgi:hypothetical protein